MVMTRGWAIVAVVAAALGAATWGYLDSQRNALPRINGYVLARPRPLPDVELVDEHAAPFRRSNFVGQWSLLFFGYTYCPDVCPLTLVELAAMKRELADREHGQVAAYYLVSVDPKRDTPERLREYVAYFDPAFRGLTGSLEALSALAQATETLFDVPDGQDADHYLVSHSSHIVLLDPHGEVRAFFTPPHDPTRLAVDFTKVVEHLATVR